MKQYLYRGLGIGIIFTSIVLLIAFGNTPKVTTMSKEEIIKQAKELGMKTQEEYDNKTFSDSKIIQLAKELGMYTQEEYDKKEIVDEEAIDQGHAQESNTQEGNTQEGNTQDENIVTLIVEKGMTSSTIANRLEEIGVIDDWKAFDRYIYEKNLNSVLQIGTYQIEKGASYATIVKILTRK